MRRIIAVFFVAAAGVVLFAPNGSAKEERPSHIVLFCMPGITLNDFAQFGINDRYAMAALSARTASRAVNFERSYLTLGAGNPAYALSTDPLAALAFRASDRFEGGRASDAVWRRTGRHPHGEVVVPAIAELADLQRSRLYGSQVGLLGSSLRRAGVTRGIVSAADLAVTPREEQMRRSAALALMDEDGGIDYGVFDGLLRPNPAGAYGVSTDARAFVRATKQMLSKADVVLLDPGETSRISEFTESVANDRVQPLRRGAMFRALKIFYRVQDLLGPRDLLLMVAPSGPLPPHFREHLAPMAAWGRGIKPSAFLTSATTRRDGMVVLSDVAPTVLDVFGIERPEAMVGTPIHSGHPQRNYSWAQKLSDLDRASGVREQFASQAFWFIAILISVLAILAYVVFLGRSEGLYAPLVAVAYFCLAFFPAAHVVRALRYWNLGVVGAHVELDLIAIVLAIIAWRAPGPRWAGAVALMLLCAGLFASDIAVGGPLQLNGVFGHSPLVAGRFYGVSNPGYAILFSSALLGFTGLAELRGQAKIPWWTVMALILIVPIDGLPTSGADLGGLLAGVPAVAVTIALGRRWRIRWRTILAFAFAAIVAALGLSFLDLLRPADSRTHLGRFAQVIASGDFNELTTIIHRKGVAALTSLTVTRWTWFIPVGFAVLVLLLIRPRGVLRDVMARRPLLSAGLWGTLVAGALGFAVNDSGISIPALALAFVVPYFVLLAVDVVKPRKQALP